MGKRLKDQLFRDVTTISRNADELEVEYSTREIVVRIWREHLRPRIGLLAIASFAMILTAATTGAIPFLIQKTADDVFVAKNQQMVYFVTAAIVVVTIIKAIAEYVGDVTVAYLGNRFIADLRIQMFAKLARADLSWIQTVHSGRLLSSFLNDATLIRATASRSLVTLGENYLKVVILIATMFYMDARFSVMILIFMPLAWFMLSRQRRTMRKSTSKSLQETGDLSALITQTLRGMRVVRAYRQEDREEARAASAVNRALEFTMRGTRARALSSPSIELLTGLGFALAIYFAGTKGVRGDLTLGHFMGFMTAALLIYTPLKSAATLQTQLQEGMAAASRVFGGDRHRGQPGRGSRCQAARPQSGRDRVQQCVVRLRAAKPGAQRRQPDGAVGKDRGVGRALGLRQEHDRKPRAPLLRSRARQGNHRRAGHQAHDH